MELPRRGFLKSGAITAVSAGIVLSSSRIGLAEAALKSKAFATPGLSFTSETFSRYLGENFQAPNSRGRMVNLKLANVRPYKVQRETKISKRTPKELRSFSLSFNAKERLPQSKSIHKMSHPALGKFDLFLTPTELKDGTFIYEAVFSHI